MISGLSVLALIPARGGSKGIIGKNIIDVGGVPMIGWTISAAKNSKYIDRVILSSDDAEIINIAHRLGCDVPFIRPSELSTDGSSTVDVVCHALRSMQFFDIVVVLQPTSPLRLSDDIDGCLDHMMSLKAQSSVTVNQSSEHPYLIYSIRSDGRMVPYSKAPENQSLQRQKLPPAWVLNGAVYAFYTKWFIENQCLVNCDTVAFPMPTKRSIDVDTIDDLNLVRSIIK